jgi:uncharacterized protein YdcH (DUF465 family)
VSVLLDEAELRERLLTNSDEYRRLASEHRSYSERLEQLARRHHLNEDEKLQEITLKKKKLLLKDQMFAMIQKYRKEMESGA